MLWGVIMKISILGNSVSLVMRPPRRNNEELTYSEILEKRYGFTVVHSGKRAAMISDTYQYLEDEVIRMFPDIVIIHFGNVECASRGRLRFINNIIEGGNYKNSIFRPRYKEGILHNLSNKGLNLISSLIERIIFLINKQFNWLKVSTFNKILVEIINIIQKETGAIIIIIGIGQTNDRIEKNLKGTRKSICDFNRVMQYTCSKITNVFFIDTFNILNNYSHTPDGIHLDSEGHKLIAEKIVDIIRREDLATN